MPTEQEFQDLVKRVKELEGFKDAATSGLINHKEGLDTLDKVVKELQERSKMTVENISKMVEHFQRHLDKNH